MTINIDKKCPMSAGDLRNNYRIASSSEIGQLQTIPVEYFALTSENFKSAINCARSDAESLWAPRGPRDMAVASAILNGEITEETPFKTVINENEYLVIAGLRTEYNGRKNCTITLSGDGVVYPPFSISKRTSRLMFVFTIIIRPNKTIELAIQGDGELHFEVIGARLTKLYAWGTLSYQTLRSDTAETGVPEPDINQRITSMVEKL